MPYADICAQAIYGDEGRVLCWLIVVGHELLQGISVLFIKDLQRDRKC